MSNEDAPNGKDSSDGFEPPQYEVRPEDSPLPIWASIESFIRRLNEHLETIVSRLVDPIEDCWIWNGYFFGDGYPCLSYHWETDAGESVNTSVRVHRAIAMLEDDRYYGPETHIHHTEKNRACCNPAHLEPKSPGDHRRDHFLEDNDPVAKLSLDDVKGIKMMIIHTNWTLVEIADYHSCDEYDVTKQDVVGIRTGQTWKYVPAPHTPPGFDEDEYFRPPGKDYAILDELDVKCILMMLSHTSMNQSEIADEFDVDRTRISRIKTGKAWPEVEHPHPIPGDPASEARSPATN